MDGFFQEASIGLQLQKEKCFGNMHYNNNKVIYGNMAG
jgi:hypothetical protein